MSRGLFERFSVDIVAYLLAVLTVIILTQQMFNGNLMKNNEYGFVTFGTVLIGALFIIALISI